MSWLAGMLLWTLSAGAAELYFEGPVHPARADAVAASRTVREAGHEARVVRRYREGSGWEYLVRVAGFGDQAEAVGAASALSGMLGGDVALYRLEEPEGEPERVQVAHRAAPEPESEPDETPPVERTVIAEREESPLDATIAAHGGAQGGAARIAAADAVLFRFRRSLADGAVIDHTWARNGADVVAIVERVEGEVTPSRTLVTEAGAWLSVDGGALEPQDRERTMETLDALAPVKVIPFALSFAALAAERKELQILDEEGSAKLDEHTVRVLRSAGDQASGPLILMVDARTALVRKVDFNGGAMVVQFDDWAAHEGAAVRTPGRVRTWREGALVDTVKVVEIDLEPKFPEDWFRAP